MRALLAYKEETDTAWRLRHPVLCGIDLCGLLLLFVLASKYQPTLLPALLLVIMSGVYLTSAAYHWLSYNLALRKLDHQMIVLLIGCTYVPYWWKWLPHEEAMWRFPILFFGTCLISYIRWRWFFMQKLGASLYLLLAAFPIITTARDLIDWLPISGVVEFWGGLACYGVNFIIHHARKPDPAPQIFGWRESQHVFVVLSITLQAHVLLLCVR